MDHERVILGLTAAQANGFACAVCGLDFLNEAVAHRAIGRSILGWTVWACVRHRPEDIVGSTESDQQWLG